MTKLESSDKKLDAHVLKFYIFIKYLFYRRLVEKVATRSIV